MHPEIANTPRMFLNGENNQHPLGLDHPNVFFMPTDPIDVQNNIFLHMYIIVHTYIIAYFTVYA